MKSEGWGWLLLGGWGRRAAWAGLVIFLVLQVGAGWLFEAPRLALFDTYQRLVRRHHLNDAVMIVAIDDASLAKVGQWPWPRQIQADLFSKILAGHPAALGIDMVWSERDQQSPEEWLQHAGMLQAPLAADLKKLTHHDTLLAGVLRGQPVAIGVVGIEKGHWPDTGSFAPFQTLGLTSPEIPGGILPEFATTIRSIPELDTAAGGHGLLSVKPDADNVFRRLPMVSLVAGTPAPALSLEMLRVTNSAPGIEMYFSGHGIEGIAVTRGSGRFVIPTQRDGSIWVHFSNHDAKRFVSAADVLNKRMSAPAFRGKLVLVGLTGTGQLDQRMTPLGTMPGVEIQAQLLENLLERNLVRRPGWTAVAEPLLTLGFALLLIVVLPLVRPRWQMLLGAGVLLCLAGLGFGLWYQSRILLDVATPAIGQALICIAYMGAGFAQADQQRRRLRLAAAKTEGELEAARRIQRGILPSPAGVAGDPRFELDALMIPARQIGGDLFDFFKMDADHLFFAVGDVSGKGVPAALFMALGKSLCKSCALRGESDIGAIIDRANREISRDNTETLFITLFAGILNLATGELRFCNAGHDAPFLLRKGEVPHSLESEGGPPLCILEDFSYPAERFQLQPGDMLCVITDGITEAMTAAGQVMGRERAGEVLAALPPGATPDIALRALHDAVDIFVAGAEPSDDLTILAVRWRGTTAL